MKYTKRFIEESFPVKEISEQAAYEKNVRSGNISTIHIWWSRKPLSLSRATNYAALISNPDNPKDLNKIRNEIIDFSTWEKSNDKTLINKARVQIYQNHSGQPPKVLDPFGGGGSIPLECLRLGCETYSNDLNPLAVLIQKCTLEYPQKYCKSGVVEKEIEDFGKKNKQKIKVDNILSEEVTKWSDWIYVEASKELSEYFPPESKTAFPIGYYWMRTLHCQNPSCGCEIPLTSNYWLAHNSKKQIALHPIVNGKKIEFEIVGTGYKKMPKGFNPENATVSRAIATCIKCGNSMVANTTRDLFQKGQVQDKMVAVIVSDKKKVGKIYRAITKDDLKNFEKAQTRVSYKINSLRKEWGFEPVPNEEIKRVPITFGVINVWLYGFKTWGDLFNPRQQLSLLIFADLIKKVYQKLIQLKYDPDFTLAIVSYLALIFSRMTDFSSNMSAWLNHVENSGHLFSRQAIGMSWDYLELNLLSPVLQGTWKSMQKQIRKALENLSQIPFVSNCYVKQASATSLPYSDSYFDAVFTDPPYYDNIPYAYLADFFYVWLKRILGDLYPDMFLSELSPKKNEIVAYTDVPKNFADGKEYFESLLKQSFQEMYRVLKPNGIALVVYAHKTTSGWETLINSLLDSELVITAAWPLNSEMTGRMRAIESATLASSIYIVCRKIDRQPTAFYNDVKEETKNHLSKKLDRLWNEGIGGADFFIAAIGTAIEIYGKYKTISDFQGNLIRADKLLADVRVFATDYAIKKILHNGFATGISDLTRFYVLSRWEFFSLKIPYDEAIKLAHSCHIELDDYWQTKSFIKKDKEFIQILGPQDRDIDAIKDSGELIDVLHYAIKLWEKGNKAGMQKVLNDSGFAKSDVFFRVAQAIAETLPNESKEKKLLEGFLNLRERISDGSKVKADNQGDFFKN